MTRPKYGNRKIEVDGYKFDSKAEAAHYQDLRLLARANKIRDLQVHPRWRLTVNGIDCGYYEADFAYFEDNERVVIDIKSPITAKNSTYRLKKRLIKAIYGLEIREIVYGRRS